MSSLAVRFAPALKTSSTGPPATVGATPPTQLALLLQLTPEPPCHTNAGASRDSSSSRASLVLGRLVTGLRRGRRVHELSQRRKLKESMQGPLKEKTLNDRSKERTHRAGCTHR